MATLSAQRNRQKFATELRRLMTLRKIGQNRLAEAAHVSPTAIGHYRMARHVPTLPLAHRLALVLDAPSLVALAREARKIKCEQCHRWFVDDNYKTVRFCSLECRRVAVKKRGSTTKDTRFRAIRAERSLTVHQAAVADMCNACEPDGVCSDGACPLRMVSPFQLKDDPVVEVDPVRPRRPSDRWLKGIRAFNEKRWTPEARAAAGERMRARHAAKTPEERSEHARATAAGIKAAKEHAA